MRRISSLIKTIRTIKNIQQSTLAEKAGISQASLSQYENNQATLSKKTIRKFIDILNINPECLNDKTANPYKSSKLHKMFIKHQPLLGFDYSVIKHLLRLNRSLKFTFLHSIFNEFKPSRTISKVIITEFVHAIFIQDQNDILYLIRYKKENTPLLNEAELQCLIKNMANKTGTDITFYTAMIPHTLTKMINNLTVERENFEEIINKPMKDNKDGGLRNLMDYIEKNHIT